MNLLHIKYAVEIAETGSINRAAEKLLIGQPNLSRAIKELESSLNVRIFERSARGMTLTSEGEIFISYAKNIIKQVEAVEETFSKGKAVKKRFSVTVPRAGYISEAFARFSASLDSECAAELIYKESGSSRIINSIIQDEYRLGIVRYAAGAEKQFQSLISEKNLSCKHIADFHRVIIMNRQCPLAEKTKISLEDLSQYTEAAYVDMYIPSLASSETKKEDFFPDSHRRISIFGRAAMFSVLSENKNVFTADAPFTSEELKRYGLVMREPEDSERIFRDVLIYRSDYTLSELDNNFISELCKTKHMTE